MNQTKALAEMTGLRESAFSRLVKKCTYRTVPEYINELRTAKACRLLADADRTASRIPIAYGYPEPAHFHWQFHKFQRHSGVAYRAAMARVIS